ncbi:MAG: DNA polymerase III subunit [Chloroflexota bacterium]
MDGFLTVGHPAAVAAVHARLGSSVPHAILISGPASVGKASLAMDLAAGLLCSGAAGADRPCRTCRTCRMVEHGNHGDLHVIEPTGAGMQIPIGKEDSPEPGSVRHLIGELVLLPIEGGQRVAIVRDADRMNDDGQGAILKTLEEPPPGTTLILCTDDEERLLPTIRSRCARLRLGTVGARDVEQLLGDRGLADPPTAARLARLTGGRPGLAIAYAASPDAATIRGELARSLLDLLREGSAVRLGAAKLLQARAGDLAAALEASTAAPEPESAPARGAKGRKLAKPAEDEPSDDEAADDAPAKATAKDRRRAVAQLLDVWRDLARDLVLAERGARRTVRDTALLEELEAAARDLPAGAASAFLARIAEADSLLKGNVSPELLLDTLLVHWPRRRRAA